jgi:hypothetical protein
MRYRTEYKDLLKDLSGGKVVHGSCYFHVTHPSAQRFLDWLISNEPARDQSEVNVLRLGLSEKDLGFSFSYYEKFFEDPFPALVWSEKYDMELVPKKKRYEGNNPAILHRKELLLPSNHPKHAQLKALTDAIVKASILPTKKFIGRRDHWNAYLNSLGYEVSGGHLVKI